MDAESLIIVVDDDPRGREVLRALLDTPAFRLAIASSGEEALTLASGLRPDLILLDVMMPGTDGFEVCRRLRSDPELADVPIIMVTALDDRASRLRGFEVGADDFVSKPFDRGELLARIRMITRLNRHRRLWDGRERFSWVVETSEDGYVSLNRDDTLVDANPRARLYLDLPAQGDLPQGVTFRAIAGLQYRCQPEEAWESWPAPPSGPRSPRYFVRSESTHAHASWLLVDVLDSRFEDGLRLVRLHDVTSQVALLRDVWRFHGAVSHKLRTPLGPLVRGHWRPRRQRRGGDQGSGERGAFRVRNHAVGRDLRAVQPHEPMATTGSHTHAARVA
jgi:DNA-binding response OmpR family regulator